MKKEGSVTEGSDIYRDAGNERGLLPPSRGHSGTHTEGRERRHGRPRLGSGMGRGGEEEEEERRKTRRKRKGSIGSSGYI